MAYMNQEKKQALSVGIKNVLKKYGVKASISVRGHSAICVNIRESAIDFGVGDYSQVGAYQIENNFTGTAKDFLVDLNRAMNNCEDFSNFDHSDSMTDYFHVGWYTEINIGRWDKPYKLIVDQAA